MQFLFNGPGPGRVTIAERLAELVGAHARRRNKAVFYALTCYFDPASIRALAALVGEQVSGAGGKLSGFHLAVDAADWIRQRADKTSLKNSIKHHTGLKGRQITITPISPSNPLVHAKGYALVGNVSPTSGKRPGFVMVTSANLTQRGFGFDIASANLEMASVDTKKRSLAAFQEEFQSLVADHAISVRRALRQERFLLALRILSDGRFYHRWAAGLTDKVAFRLTMTPSGKLAQRERPTLFAGYESDADSFSRDILGVQALLEDVRKPFGKAFWRTYSVDTILGRWIPNPVTHEVDAVLDRAVDPYIEVLRTRVNGSEMDRAFEVALLDVQKYRGQGLIREDEEAVVRWRDRLQHLPSERALLTRAIFKYSAVPDLLDASKRSEVLETFDDLESQLREKPRRSGLKGALVAAIDDGAARFKRDMKALASRAKDDLRGDAPD